MSLGRQILRSTSRSLPVVAGLLTLTTTAQAIPPATMSPVAPHVVEQALFSWNGRVDREVILVMRGRTVRVRGEDRRTNSNVRVAGAVPRARGDVIVRLQEGRGDVDVIEQPSARNDYQTTVRVRDPRGGDDRYRLVAYWLGDDRFDDRRDNSRDNDRRDRGGEWGVDDRHDNDRFPGKGRGKGRGNGRDDGRNGGRDDGRDDGREDTGSGVLRWSGRVDDVVEVRIRGRRVDVVTRSGQRVENVDFNIRGGGLPSRGVRVDVDEISGRGNVSVSQQPSAWNGYTAVIRINDSRGGAAFYDFAVCW